MELRIPKLLMPKQLIQIIFGVLALVCSCATVAVAQPRDSVPTREYQIKASLIFNIIHYIRWPPDVSNTTLRICIVGEDRFGGALRALESELVDGRRIEISRLPTVQPDALRSCQVAFVSGQSPSLTEEVLSAVDNQSVLTIGESSSFIGQGGMVALIIEGGRIVFDINRVASLPARLEFSSKLLRLARVVKN